MTKLTALQKAMRIVEKYSPNLFQVYSQDSRDFLSEMKSCLSEEKEQITKAFLDGYRSHPYMAEQYYNEIYGGDK
jgi:hypothetical protein